MQVGGNILELISNTDASGIHSYTLKFVTNLKLFFKKKEKKVIEQNPICQFVL